MEVVSKKEETHVATFTADEIVEVLTNMMLKKIGHDPSNTVYDNKTVVAKGINIPKTTKIKGHFGVIPIIEITILNPKFKHNSEPAQK